MMLERKPGEVFDVEGFGKVKAVSSHTSDCNFCCFISCDLCWDFKKKEVIGECFGYRRSDKTNTVFSKVEGDGYNVETVKNYIESEIKNCKQKEIGLKQKEIDLKKFLMKIGFVCSYVLDNGWKLKTRVIKEKIFCIQYRRGNSFIWLGFSNQRRGSYGEVDVCTIPFQSHEYIEEKIKKEMKNIFTRNTPPGE
ncbi:MAG: hypothetical protein GY679_01930 [Mycoplasma sp.]|nr:hypothetical protein [Mycoplasma sp.]